MSLRNIHQRSINEVDLKRLIEGAVRENRIIEYKREWRLGNDADKREFLADVTSFANAAGGEIVYGVEADHGLPTALRPLEGFALESEQLRAEQVLGRWVDPRIPGLSFQSVPLSPGGSAFVVRIPSSWSGPHMVTFNDSSRFFSRNSAGKYQLDVNEIGAAFLGRERSMNRRRDFRLERVSRIAAGEVGVTLASKYCVCLHLMPLGELTTYDPATVVQLQTKGLHPMGEIHSMGELINFDGCMIKATGGAGSVYSYVQVFRNGHIEAVLCSSGAERHKAISPGYEGVVRAGLRSFIQALGTLGLTPPFVVGLTHINVQDFTIAESPERSGWHSMEQTKIARPNLLVPEAILEALDEASTDQMLRTLFDQVWNACGRLRSPNFDVKGKYAPPRD